METEKQLNDEAVYKEENFDEDLISNLTGKSNRLFQSLNQRQLISEKDFAYFRFKFINTCNIGQFYLLPKIHKRLSNLPGRPVICSENNIFEFNNQIKQQIAETVIATKCAPTYACIFMDKVETEFLEKQTDKPF